MTSTRLQTLNYESKNGGLLYERTVTF